MSKIYAVRKGRIPGIYYSWKECEQQVKGFSGAEYKGFLTEKEAIDFYNKKSSIQIDFNFTEEQKQKMINDFEVVNVFVDGSFDPLTRIYSYGLVALGFGEIYEENFADYDEELSTSNNVVGEVEGSIAAIEYAMYKGAKELNLYFDYEGIEKWAIGDWECEKDVSKEYKHFIDIVSNHLKINFFKIESHTGIEYNERADVLAKEAIKERRQMK